jgi:hypothetical protein
MCRGTARGLYRTLCLRMDGVSNIRSALVQAVDCLIETALLYPTHPGTMCSRCAICNEARALFHETWECFAVLSVVAALVSIMVQARSGLPWCTSGTLRPCELPPRPANGK